MLIFISDKQEGDVFCGTPEQWENTYGGVGGDICVMLELSRKRFTNCKIVLKIKNEVVDKPVDSTEFVKEQIKLLKRQLKFDEQLDEVVDTYSYNLGCTTGKLYTWKLIEAQKIV